MILNAAQYETLYTLANRECEPDDLDAAVVAQLVAMGAVEDLRDDEHNDPEESGYFQVTDAGWDALDAVSDEPEEG